ncbi:hypothetical protein [Nostoc sp.]|uniref:hypothetical protein n=1 Tax=Nostoc sp. TaxID=1180 RepID=UPI002FFBD9CC
MDDGEEVLRGRIDVKLRQTPTPQYDLSRVFALFPFAREGYKILQILKGIGKAIARA